ncbi:MAG: redoxin domain-containing protein [Bacteroidota bacterium]
MISRSRPLRLVLVPCVAVFLLAVWAWRGTGPPSVAKVDDAVGQVPDFGLYDSNGAFHTLSYYSDAPAVVLFVQGNGCPIARHAAPAFQDIRDRFEPEGVVFFMLNASLQDDRRSINAEVETFGLDVPILVDEDQLVAQALEVRRTAEAIVVDGRTQRIVYRGPVDDRLGYESQRAEATTHYLADALRAHLSGVLPEVRVVPPKGCLLALPERETAPTYTGEIASILETKCQACHQSGGIGPWAMTDYETVRGWAPMIREVVMTRRMPPWQADPSVGHLASERVLTDAERRAIVEWVDAGAPRGDGGDPFAERIREPLPEWPLGPPDLVLTLPPQSIPATGVVDYRYETVDIELDRDEWVRAVDIRPGTPAVLHHAIAVVEHPDVGSAPRGKNRWRDDMLEGYSPGSVPTPFPDGSARLLPAGSSLALQLHYVTIGRALTDSIRVGLYLAGEPPERQHASLAPRPRRLDIPAGDPAYRASAAIVLEDSVLLHSVRPHMHYRGAEVRYEVVYPGGRRDTLVSVPQYSFNWQHRYEMAEPLSLPRGTRLECHARFDNSSRNPLNPDPSRSVRWGRKSTDEMLICYADVTRPFDRHARPLYRDPLAEASE